MQDYRVAGLLKICYVLILVLNNRQNNLECSFIVLAREFTIRIFIGCWKIAFL